MAQPGRRKAGPGSRDGSDRRADLLEAAYTLIGERGLEGLRTRDIAARAGVNISTLHYYFGTKEALLSAVVEHTSGKFTASTTAPVSLRDHFEHTVRTFRAMPHLSTVLQELSLRAQRDDATRAALVALHDRWNAVVAGLLRVEIAQGRMRPDVDVTAGARVVTSFVLGAIVQLGVNPQAFDFLRLAADLESWMGSFRSVPAHAERVR